MDFVITQVNHKISKNNWETNLVTLTTSNQKITTKSLKTVKSNPIADKNVNNVTPTPASKTLEEVLISAGYKPGTFKYELALAMGNKEGYIKDSTNRPSRNNNPGNLDYSPNLNNFDPKVALEPKVYKNTTPRFAKFSTPELGAKALIEQKITSWGKGVYPPTTVNGAGPEDKAYRKAWKVPKSLDSIAYKKINLTLEQFLYIYAPPSENSTETYIKGVVNALNKKYPEFNRNSRIIDWLNK
jgi:hypothetical protein